MSKAFTREDDAPDDAPQRSFGAELPPGVKNYMTPAGAAAVRAEVDALAHRERAAGAAGDAHALREIEPRRAFLARRLEALEIIDPAGQPADRVRFGATVTVRTEGGDERRYRLVGVDEAAPARGDVSWRSPIAVALLGAELGAVVTLRTPRGDEELEIVGLRYDATA